MPTTIAPKTTTTNVEKKLPQQQLQPTNPKSQPKPKTKPKKQLVQKKLRRNTHNNNQLKTTKSIKFLEEKRFSSSKRGRFSSLLFVKLMVYS
jgi:hypothetical protein